MERDEVETKQMICPVCCPAESLTPCATDGCGLMGSSATLNMCKKCCDDYMDQEMETMVRSLLGREEEGTNVTLDPTATPTPTPPPEIDKPKPCVGDAPHPLCAHGCDFLVLRDSGTCNICSKCYNDHAKIRRWRLLRQSGLAAVFPVSRNHEYMYPPPLVPARQFGLPEIRQVDPKGLNQRK